MNSKPTRSTRCLIWICVVLGFWLVGMTYATPVKIILDTDMASDCDDLGAVAVLHALANQGKAEILGMVCDVSDGASPLCLSAINTYYGRASIPIGCVRDDYVSPCLTPAIDAAYFLGGMNRYTDYIGNTVNYPRGFVTDAVPDALGVYTNLLKANTGVTIVSIGSLYNLAGRCKTGWFLSEQFFGHGLIHYWSLRSADVWPADAPLGCFDRGSRPVCAAH